MNTEHQITVSGLQVQVVRKAIKNLHLGVYPPNGRVRVAAPLRVSDEAVRLAVVGKLGWIRRHQLRFKDQARQTRREMTSGESHYYMGRRYRLRVVESAEQGKVTLRNKTIMELCVPPEASILDRARILQKWYREQLKGMISMLLNKWQDVMGAEVAEWGIKKMKTRWGSCNTAARRIWLNLELAKKPVACLEYILVHELAHLQERRHNDRFQRLMDGLLPKWRQSRAELNRAPLCHEEWGY